MSYSSGQGRVGESSIKIVSVLPIKSYLEYVL
jgi:hypothetical protein